MGPILLICALLFAAAPASAEQPAENMPLYESLEDPVGQQPTRILAEGNTLHFGSANADRNRLQRSDLGFVIYFARVDGGVRVRGQPLVFPDGTRTHFDFEDFSCSVLRSGAVSNVLCRRKSDGQLFHSTVTNGGLESFDIACFDLLDQVCHYRLIGGQPVLPAKIQ